MDANRVRRTCHADDPGACAKRAARRQTRSSGRKQRAADHNGVPAIVFVSQKRGQRKFAAPEIRIILERPWTDYIEKLLWNADVRNGDLAARRAARVKKMTRLLAKKGYGALRAKAAAVA